MSSSSKFDAWVVLGFVAQGFFTMRFVVQWIASERARKSVIPVAFWFFSIGGGVLLLVYALYRRDPVFIAGQALGLVVYVRNLYFIIVNGRQAGAGVLLTPTRQLSGVEGLKPAFKIGLEILDILQSDVEPQGRSARRPFGGRAIGRAVERNDKALEAAP